MSEDNFYDGLSKEDIEFSKRGLELLQGKAVNKFRWDSKRQELFIEFDDHTRLYIDNITDNKDISVV